MAKQTILTGTTANDKTGDTLRAAFIKANANFTELYNAGVQGVQGITGAQGTQGIQGRQGITGAGTQGIQGTMGSTPWTFIGPYNNGTYYNIGDAVTYDGGFYYRTGNPINPGYSPTPGTINESWTPVADKGAQGIEGLQGVQGIQGITGADGISVSTLKTLVADSTDFADFKTRIAAL